MKPRNIFTKNFIAPFICTLFVVSGILTLKLFPSFYKHILKTEFTLSPGSKTYEIWQKTPMPLSLEFYLFNWTNPQDITNSSIKPKFVEMGPYRFVEKYEKVDIVWNDNNDTVTFKQLRYWHFDEEGSNGSLKDKVTTLNAVAVSASYAARHFTYISKRGLSLTLSALVKNIYITRTVGELLFDGYPDTLIDMVNSLPSFGVDTPPWDKFAWFYDRNGTTDFNGVLNMATGKGKFPMGQLENWNFDSKSKYYQGECGKIDGSAGEFFPPHRVKNDPIRMFSPEMCRKIEFDYEEEVEVKGVRGYKYVGGPRLLDNGTLYPENKCYCNGECVPSGLLNVSSCRYGSPGFISFPHYYGADPYYLDQVEGLNPDIEKHQFHIILEPTTGIPLDVTARFQINILLQPIQDISFVESMPKIFFPMLWFEQKVTITNNLATGLFTLLHLPLISSVTGISLIIIGIVSLLIIIALKVKKHFDKLKKKNKMLNLTKEEVPLNDTNSPKIKIQSSY